jgi:MFS transporter, FHS family, L-fucose permease
MKKTDLLVLPPIFFGFFVMGFVDIVGISTNYVKQDFALSDTLANMLPMMVFLWFAVLSVPVGLMMNKLGRKNTVLISMVITAIALMVPSVSYSFTSALIAFALLGIGNTIIQVSLNPLVTNVIAGEKIASSLTLGQFIKAIASFLGPIIAGYAAKEFGNWKLIFPVYALITVISAIWLGSIKVNREQSSDSIISFGQCFGLLKNRYILLLFLGILLIVGVDVGLNTTIPKYLSFKSNLPLEKAGLGISLYFAARTLGTLLGTFILMRVPVKTVFRISAIIAIIGFGVMLISSGLTPILVLIFIVGFACANVFSMIFTLAISRMPDKTNEISGLMIMGVAGGALILPLMGVLSDAFGMMGSMYVLLACLFYLLILAFSLKQSQS